MSKYYENRKKAETITVGQTKTDQSAAANTDINVIVRNYIIHGSAPGSSKPPMYGDFSEIPDNLRDMIDLGRSIEGHRAALPPGLQDMTVQELVTTDPKQLAARIAQEGVYIERHAKLPQHLKSLGKNDLLNLSEKEFNAMIAPPAPPAPQQETKT